jgi:hypothetical protein
MYVLTQRLFPCGSRRMIAALFVWFGPPPVEKVSPR